VVTHPLIAVRLQVPKLSRGEAFRLYLVKVDGERDGVSIRDRNVEDVLIGGESLGRC
jgi:hypothetical protein